MKRKDRYAKFFSGRVVTRSKSIRKTRLIPETLECRTVMDGSGWIPSDLLNLQHDEIVLSVTSGPSELGITDQSADTQFLVAPAPGQFEPVSTSVSTDTSQNLTDPSSDFLVMPVGPSVPSAKFSPVPSETEVIVALRGDDGLSRLTHWAGQGTNASSLVNDAGSQILFINQGLTYISLPTPSGQTEKVIALLEQQTFVEWASPNMIYSTQGGFDPREFVPNDPYYNLQWHHPLMGNTQAWDEAGTFGGGIVVAILDDGVRLNHPDLTDNIWVNPLEIPGNGIDDDGNGYTDDVQGWDFSASDNNPNPDSTTSHGTPVAGNVAARINNNTGVAGVAGNATLLPVRFYGSGAWTSSIVAQSYAYSVDNGARILNVSYNIDGFANDPLFRASLQYVYDSGAIYMNSAGNNGQLNPARGVFDQSLFVMASDPDDKLLPYSNYGTFIDLVAPADPVATTSDTGYEYFNGTSSATPVASGAMALAWGANPTWTRDQVIAAILGNTDNIDAQNPGLADYLGYGRVNTFKALTMTPAAPKLGAISGLPAEGSTITEVLSDFTIDTASIYDASTITSSQFEMRYAGGDGILDTSDDRLIPIAVQSVNGGDYSYGTNKLSLQVRGSMPPGSYRFSALSGESGILDPFGQQLDGNGDGIAGDSLTRTFQVSYQVSGFAYIDDNRDSQFQTDEFSISGITVFADANANGMVDLNAPVQVNSTNVPVSILDNTTVNSTLSVNLGNNSIASIKVGLSLNHTYDSDLTIELYSPSGKRVLLVSGAGGSGDNFSNTVFDDNATRSIYSGSAPFTGSFRPAEPLSAFAGENPDGTWRLAITDSYTYDTGTLLSWNLEIVTPQEALSTTKLNGGWSFNGLPDGSYDIIAVNPAEVYMGLMTPISGSYGVTISSPDDSFDGLDFGFIPRPVYEVHSLGMNYFNGDLLGFSANLTQDSEIKRITIRNLGVGTILFDSISISSPFEIVSPVPTEIPYGQSVDLDIVFHAQNPGTIQSPLILKMKDLDPSTPATLTLNLTGVGITPSVSGQVLTDFNANGILDNGETAFTGIGLFADLNNNGQIDTGTLSVFPTTGLPVSIPDAGSTSVTATISGVSGYLSNMTVNIQATHTWSGDLKFLLVNPAGFSALLYTDPLDPSGTNFNVTFDDRASTEISSGVVPSGTVRPLEPLQNLIYSDPNGVWTLYAFDQVFYDQGSITGFTIAFELGAEPQTYSDTEGKYLFINLPAGDLNIRAMSTPVGMVYADPVGGVFTTSLTANQMLLGVNFVPLPVNSISGQITSADTGDGVRRVRVFNDLNGNNDFDYQLVERTSNGSRVSIRDLKTVSKSVTVSGSTLPINDIEVVLNIRHRHVGDLVVTLISPAGIRINLLNRDGGRGQNLNGVVFSDHADSTLPTGTSNYTGSYLSKERLSQLNNTGANGTWTVEVSDMALGDIGWFNSFAIRLITTQETTTVSNSLGFYSMYVTAGPNFNLKIDPVSIPGLMVSDPSTGQYQFSLPSGSAVNGKNFVLALNQQTTGESLGMLTAESLLPSDQIFYIPPDLIQELSSIGRSSNTISKKKS